MPLVNAFQNHSPDAFNHQLGEPASRFIKIRSVWPFPVKNSQAADEVDSEQPLDEAGDSVAPSSFVT